MCRHVSCKHRIGREFSHAISLVIYPDENSTVMDDERRKICDRQPFVSRKLLTQYDTTILASMSTVGLYGCETNEELYDYSRRLFARDTLCDLYKVQSLQSWDAVCKLFLNYKNTSRQTIFFQIQYQYHVYLTKFTLKIIYKYLPTFLIIF